jgi:hypothetical protein
VAAVVARVEVATAAAAQRARARQRNAYGAGVRWEADDFEIIAADEDPDVGDGLTKQQEKRRRRRWQARLRRQHGRSEAERHAQRGEEAAAIARGAEPELATVGDWRRWQRQRRRAENT